MPKWPVLALLALAACGADRQPPPQEPGEQPEAPPPEAGSEEASFRTLDVRALKQRMDEGWDPFVLDVREPDEVAAASVSFTDRYAPLATVQSVAAELPRDRDIVVLCKSGRRSAMAAETLVRAGFDPAKIHSLDGGITAWSDQIDPSVPKY